MKILVTAKQVTDSYTTVTLRADGQGINRDDVGYELNPFCEIAIEEAVRIIEDDADDGEVVAVCIGSDDATKEVRSALAIGADRGILIECDEEKLDSDLVAQMLVKVCESEKPDLVIMGKQATDGDSNQAGQLLAEYMGWPQATFAYKVEVNDGLNGAMVQREVDGGVETVEIQFPAVITTDLRLNEPRSAGLFGIKRARKKPLDVMTPDDLGVSMQPKVETVSFDVPSERQAGMIVDSVDALIEKLANEAKVI